MIPEYLPVGDEDATTIAVGLKAENNTISTVLLWRTNNHVYSVYGTLVSMKKFTSANVEMELDIKQDNCPKVVLSSSGLAAELYGVYMGQYFQCDADNVIYKQLSTDKVMNKEIVTIKVLICFDNY